MKRRKQTGLPEQCAVIKVAVNEPAPRPAPENTVLSLMDRMTFGSGQPRPLAAVTSRQRPAMPAKELFSDRLQREQNKFDAEAAKVPRDKFVKGSGSLISKRGL